MSSSSHETSQVPAKKYTPVKNGYKKVLVVGKTPRFSPARSGDRHCVVIAPLGDKTPYYGPNRSPARPNAEVATAHLAPPDVFKMKYDHVVMLFQAQ